MSQLSYLLFICIFVYSCGKDEKPISPAPTQTPTAFKGIKSITYNNLTVDVVIDKPAIAEVDVLVVYHGTVLYDTFILQAAANILDILKKIIYNKNIMLVSVAYPGEKMLLGDNIAQAEAALLWVKNKASLELGVTVKKVFLVGHSQGGYLVTRLNTMHSTNGVIANAPGPLNLVYRCQLEESGQIASGSHCTRLRNAYGTTSSNSNAYFQRSLLNFTQGFKSDILFVQGMDDSPIQMYSYPTFKNDVLNCTNCKKSQFVEIAGGQHGALFQSEIARLEFNKFIQER
ncbi:MAG: alpha/beta hydrolase family protein [Chitinophagales bacterium]